jgi:hypothetical protein
MRRALVGLTLAAGLLLLAGAVPAQEKQEVRVVKYAALGAEVVKHRGKVVLVEFWHTT